MTLTRQHFQLVADLLKLNARHRMRLNEYIAMCEEIAADLDQYNAAFNKKRFLSACM